MFYRDCITVWGLIDDWYDEYRYAEVRHRIRLVIHYPDGSSKIIWSSKYAHSVFNILPVDSTRVDTAFVNLLLEQPVAGVRAVWEKKQDGKWEISEDPRFIKERKAEEEIVNFYESLI